MYENSESEKVFMKVMNSRGEASQLLLNTAECMGDTPTISRVTPLDVYVKGEAIYYIQESIGNYWQQPYTTIADLQIGDCIRCLFGHSYCFGLSSAIYIIATEYGKPVSKSTCAINLKTGQLIPYQQINFHGKVEKILNPILKVIGKM